MRPIPLLISALFLLLPLRAQETERFVQFIAGQKLGGSEIRTTQRTASELIESREWLKLSRLGMESSQEIRQSALKKADGSQHFTWRVQLSQEPFEGEADWSPQEPRVLKLRAKGSQAKEVAIPAQALLWPGDSSAQLKEAARSRRPVRIISYSFPTQQWTEMDLGVPVASPLPGFADAMRFKGYDAQGPTRMDVQLWVSPTKGELRHTTTFSGLEMISQREELPEPGAQAPSNFFDATMKAIPLHPILTWLPELTVRWSGKGHPRLPEDAQQTQLIPGRFRLRRAASPSLEEARELPVTGVPSPEDTPFLAATPLVQFQDPAFDGLIQRLRPLTGASRWVLAQRVNAFVYDWIERKDFTVGFASALEVCHTPQGDCTEHGVLAVALLRKLGIPARGVAGWVALDKTLGLHFWVEVKLGQRWVPIDPTFDQAPASAFRLKLGTSDLADLGSLGWESAAQAFSEGSWGPEGPWAADLQLLGDTVAGPGGLRLRYPGGRWALQEGQLTLNGNWRLKASARPFGEQREEAKYLAVGTRKGWWLSDHSAEGKSREPKVWIQAGEGRCLEVGPVSEVEAYRLLDALEIRIPD